MATAPQHDITRGTYWPNKPGARTIAESRPLYVGNERVSIEVGDQITLFHGMRIVYQGDAPAGVQTASDLYAWAAAFQPAPASEPMSRVQLTIPAIDVRPGDMLVDMPVEKDYTVRAVQRVEIGQHTPAEIAEHGGWINLLGDTEDGYYTRHYEGEQEYYAAPDQMITVWRAAEAFLDMSVSARHDHSTTTGLVGYVVRETIRNGVVLRNPDNSVGVDVAVVLGGHNYAATFGIRDSYRDLPGGYAVVDSLYGCGCRGGQRRPTA